MSRFLHRLYHPEIFQGSMESKKYFEGWYYKLVSRDESSAIAVIPGIALYDHEERHAFIQVMDGVKQHSAYHTFSMDEFSFSKNELDIRIGKNRFTRNGMSLSLEEMSGEILFSDMYTLKASMFSPGIMGWYSFVPFMQCYHGIVSVYHQLQGSTNGNIGTIDWNGGTGYIEKDWGSSFPKCWIWIHSNHFRDPQRVSLMASVAHIPWMGNFFPGFIVLFWVNGKEYRFATYNQSEMKCNVDEGGVNVSFRRKNLQLDIYAHRGKTAELRSPITGQMKGKLNESLQAKLDVQLSDHNKIIFASTATSAGLEVAGDTTILESDTWRRK